MDHPPHIPSQEGNEAAPRWWDRVRDVLAYWLWRRWVPRLSSDDGSPSTSTVERGYEGETADVRGVTAFAVVLLLGIAVTLLVLVGLYRWFDAPDGGIPSRFAGVERIPPEPRLQHAPAVDMSTLHRRENERLNTYGWVDSARTTVHIPIEHAIRVVAERGLPYDTTAREDTTYRTISESGFTRVRRGPASPSSPPFLGGSPEPAVTSMELLLDRPGVGSQFPVPEEPAAEQEHDPETR